MGVDGGGNGDVDDNVAVTPEVDASCPDDRSAGVAEGKLALRTAASAGETISTSQ